MAKKSSKGKAPKSGTGKKASAKTKVKTKAKAKKPAEKTEAKAVVEAENEKGGKKRGRKPGSKNKRKPTEKHVEMGMVTRVDLADIDLNDENFRFRTKLLVNDLVESIGQDGLQVPVILRPAKSGDKPYHRPSAPLIRIRSIF